MTSASHAPHSLPADLVELVHHPGRTFPRLFARTDLLAPLLFPAVSGIYFAYAAAQALRLGDRFGFGPTVIAVVVGGALLGCLALYFAGTLPAWGHDLISAEDERECDRMSAVFGYATWPFLPLLAIAVPVDLLLYGSAVFSAHRPSAPVGAVWVVRLLELGTIGLWLALMIKGTALAEQESEGRAARRLGRWAAEVVVIGVLLLLIVLVSIGYW